ncbi:Capsular polysaccharide synthesis enzyme CpsE [Pseudoalteromonas luteoviolacea B = ATCC 29581]|nr:Capsular polysaccharide synthesis enzyme CpsE [Pseudoalteromonas luteoviolacea B = ATCC 29581]
MFAVFKRLKSLYQRYNAPEAVYIYQMGKVGSTSFEESLPCGIHVHTFFRENHTCAIRQEGLAGVGVRYHLKRLLQELEFYLMRRAFVRREQRKIITLVRKPFERNVSMFFHDLDSYLFAYYTGFGTENTRPCATRVQDKTILQRAFYEVFPHQYPLNWFDDEFKRLTGIDIYQYPYDKSLGAQLVEVPGTSVLLLDIDKIAANQPLIEQFLGHEFSLSNANVGAKKWYAPLYSSFDTATPECNALRDTLQASKYYKHFY